VKNRPLIAVSGPAGRRSAGKRPARFKLFWEESFQGTLFGGLHGRGRARPRT
jgi:hypothetical protein